MTFGQLWKGRNLVRFRHKTTILCVKIRTLTYATNVRTYQMLHYLCSYVFTSKQSNFSTLDHTQLLMVSHGKALCFTSRLFILFYERSASRNGAWGETIAYRRMGHWPGCCIWHGSENKLFRACVQWKHEHLVQCTESVSQGVVQQYPVMPVL